MKPPRIAVFLALVLGSVAVTALADRYGNLTRIDDLEQRTLDWRQITAYENRRSGERESPVALVFFDEAATASWPYLSPFPRAFLADLIESLSRAGARTIGLDVYLERRYPELNRMDAGDERLREAMADAGNVVLVGPTVASDSGYVFQPPDPWFADVASGVGAADLPTAFETVREAPLAVRSADELRASFSLSLYAHARDLDADSILRRARATGVLALPGLPPSLRELPEAWQDGTSADRGSRAVPGRRGDPGGPGEARDDPGGPVRHAFPIRYLGPPSHGALPGTFPAYRASEAVSLAAFAPEFFRDKIVLLGSGWHDTDKFQTPYYGFFPAADSTVRTVMEATGEDHYDYMFGMEVHANALQNLLDGTFIRRLSGSWAAILLFVVAGIVAGVVFWKGAGWGAGSAVATALGVWITAYWAYTGTAFLPVAGSLGSVGPGFVWMPVVTPFVAVLLSYVGSTAYVSVVEGREKRFIRSAMGKYVPREVVDEIAENPAALRLGGQRRALTVLFSDLAGFTTLSETLEPEELITLLNRYLTVMTNLVMDEEGTLDKYIGDAIMAFWNAPRSQADHADRALRCAVRMQREIRRLNGGVVPSDSIGGEARGGRRDSRPAAPSARSGGSARSEGSDRREVEIGLLSVRIGINTGDVVVGNVGGEERFDYSAIGDPVNLAARLEPANKTYGTGIMASELTLGHADESAYRLRELDLVAVKGRREPVRVFEVLELADHPLPTDLDEALDHFESGLRAYRNRDWSLASEYFSAALEIRPDDGPSRLYLDRSRAHIVDPPPADWDFVIRRTVK
ncbi:MAG: CHASE2 domain-containing protein [Longimicrobiales bacterium]